MNKKELATAMAKKTDLSVSDCERAIWAFTGVVKEALLSDDKVSLAGFGIFEKRFRSGRDGRNPQTGEAIRIADSYAVGFKAGKAFKEYLN